MAKFFLIALSVWVFFTFFRRRSESLPFDLFTHVKAAASAFCVKILKVNEREGDERRPNDSIRDEKRANLKKSILGKRKSSGNLNSASG